jgi:hypothetical protein
MSAVAEAKSAEIDRNLASFLELLPGILAGHAGQYALMRATGIVGYYPTAMDAQMAGNQMFPDRVFSIQQVTDTAEELGSWWHALHPRPT